jgi:hypothetical protein
MTEAAWLAATEPEQMLDYLKGDGSDRKFLLFACGCCRRIWPLVTDIRSQRAVEMIERHADHPVVEPEYNTVFWDAQDATGDEDKDFEDDPAYHAAEAAYSTIPGSEKCRPVFNAMATAGYAARACLERREVEKRAQTDLLRDIFGNPFRPVTFSPHWRTPTVVALARQMYESRDFSPMPILADALQDAGCGNDDILSHCREPVPHVRGCWVVDLVLGKA